MAYKKTEWVDRVIDPETGEVVQEGTLINAVNMNHIEDGIANCEEEIKKCSDETPEYRITEVQSASYAKSYKLQVRYADGEWNDVSGQINIPKDMVVSDGIVKKCTEKDKPISGLNVGDAYLDLTIANSDNKHIYINAKDLGSADAIISPQTAVPGQVLVVTEVDGNGKPTAWNYIDAGDLIDYPMPAGVYGFHIDGSNSNPETAVTYVSGAVGMTPAKMNYSTGKFDYGSWSDAFFMPRPCMLRNDGTVAYYLDENDYTKKEDGTASDISNPSFAGNAMMEWGRDGQKIWYAVIPDKNRSSSCTVYVSNTKINNKFHAWSFIGWDGTLKDHFYTPIYNGSMYSSKLRSLSGRTVAQNNTAAQETTYAKANGDGWNTEVYCDIELINILLILMGKSLDTQTVFGVGNMSGYVSTSNPGMLNTGTMNSRGLFWGKNASSTSDNSGVKVFGMENWWGNQYRRFAGLININGSYMVKMCYGDEDGSTVADYNETGTGYRSLGKLPTSSGYISQMDFTNSLFLPQAASGSTSTYFCDYFATNASGTYYACRGGYCSNGADCGAFSLGLNGAASVSSWSIGASLSYKSP